MTGREFDELVGRRLKEARFERQWTQKTLGLRSGITTNSVARIERGEISLSLLTAKRLCDALDISVEVLVGGVITVS